MTRCATGVWICPDTEISCLVDAVVTAEKVGIDEIWIGDEGVMRDPAVVFAAAAGATERIRFGIGITSPLLRHPGAIAATVASLDELSGGRMMLGLGVGGELSLAPFGIVADRPLAVMRDALQTARAVLQRVDSTHYSVPVHAAPAREVPLFVASRGERINRLASREADGVFLSGLAAERLDEVVGWARSAGAPRLAVYQSARFAREGTDDPTVVSGSPSEIATSLAALVERYSPASIGLALVGGGDPVAMVLQAAEAFDQQSRIT